MFKGWTWQKWVSRGTVAAISIAGIIFKFVAPEISPDWQPSWWIPISSFAVLVINGLLALIPAKKG